MTEILTGVGRIVWGHPLRSREKIYMDGPNKGQPVIKQDGSKVTQWSFGLAIPKAEFAPIWAAMQQEAATGYPNGTPPRFSWKIKDGDGIDDKGQPFNLREGYAGCYVLTITTEAFAPSVFKYENGAYRQLTADELKCGDYLCAKLNFKVNVATGTNTPSLYVNPLALELVGYGKEIVSAGVDPMAAFGGRQHQLPPGASAVPISAAPAGYGMPAPGGYAPQPGGMPAPGGYAPQPGGMPAPAPDFVQNAGQQQPMQGYAPAAGMTPGQMPPR